MLYRWYGTVIRHLSHEIGKEIIVSKYYLVRICVYLTEMERLRRPNSHKNKLFNFALSTKKFK